MAQEARTQQTQTQTDRNRDIRQPHDVATGAVSSARTVLSDVVEATGDLATTVVRTTTEVGGEIIHGVGSLGNDAVSEISRLFVTVAGGVRNTLGTLVTTRFDRPDQRDQAHTQKEPDVSGRP